MRVLKIIGVLVIPALLILFASCQKETDFTFGNSRTLSDSTILKKYIEFDTTLPAGLDTISILNLEYDNSGRLVKTSNISKELLFPPSPTFPYFEINQYFYNGAERLPYKVIGSHKNSIYSSDDTVYLFYANGKVVIDSIREKGIESTGFPYEYLSVRRYVDNGNTATASTLYTFTLNPPSWPPPCPGTSNYQKTYLNGNIIKEVINFSDCAGIGSGEFNAIYDTNPNPLYQFRIPYFITDGYLGGQIQKNNQLESWTFTGQDWYRYSYTYRSDGYPLILRAFDVNDPASRWKGIYIYQ